MVGVAFLPPPVVFAQHANPIEPAGAEVQLELRCPAKRFQLGEVIPLDLLFRSTVARRYQLNRASYDRSGRMDYEQFVITPEGGTSDPLRAYFKAYLASMGGGLTGFEFLSATPGTIHLELNEWVRIDQPGIYQLTVISGRVGDTQGTSNAFGKRVEVKSNKIEFEVTLANPQWQQAQLAGIRQQLDQPMARGNGLESQRAAIKELRYLGTEDAARELARRFGADDSQPDIKFGLIGSPNRLAGLREMEALLRSPDFGVSGAFVETMSILPLDPDGKPEVLQKAHEENLKHYQALLIESLSEKLGKARAITADTVINSLESNASADIRKRVATSLLEGFDELPAQTQAFDLQYRWKLLKSAEFLPMLRRVAQRYRDYPVPNESNAFQELQLTGAALTRWYELDPQGARDAVIAEIERPKPRYNAHVLGLLPEKTLPEVERTLAEHFVAATQSEAEANAGSLLHRYATGAVLGEVLPKIEKQVGHGACEVQTSALAYVLKVDPAAARGLLERAIAARGAGATACRHTLFTGIGGLEASPLLEELAIHSLNDADPQVAIDAARYLGRYGSAGAEGPLWACYEAWNRRWKSRANELRFIAGDENPNQWQANLGDTLASSLATGIGWLSDAAKLSRIQDLALTEVSRQQIESQMRDWAGETPSIVYVPLTPPSFQMLQYLELSFEDLKTKLAQFPSGTRFWWTGAEPSVSSEQEKSFQEMATWATEQGYRVTR